MNNVKQKETVVNQRGLGAEPMVLTKEGDYVYLKNLSTLNLLEML